MREPGLLELPTEMIATIFKHVLKRDFLIWILKIVKDAPPQRHEHYVSVGDRDLVWCRQLHRPAAEPSGGVQYDVTWYRQVLDDLDKKDEVEFIVSEGRKSLNAFFVTPTSARKSCPAKTAFHLDKRSDYTMSRTHQTSTVSVAVEKGTKMAARWRPAGGAGRSEPFPPIRRCCSERPGAVKGAPLLGASKRTLDGEDRSEMIAEQGKAGRTCSERWSAILVPSPAASNTTGVPSNNPPSRDLSKGQLTRSRCSIFGGGKSGFGPRRTAQFRTLVVLRAFASQVRHSRA